MIGIPCLAMLLGGRKRLNELFPDRLHSLGPWGPFCNIVAVFFVVQAIVIYCFPATLPVSADSMNYGEYTAHPELTPVVVFITFFGILLGAIWFLFARHSYRGPNVSRHIACTDEKEAFLAQISMQ